jgi:hypothetical protein
MGGMASVSVSLGATLTHLLPSSLSSTPALSPLPGTGLVPVAPLTHSAPGAFSAALQAARTGSPRQGAPGAPARAERPRRSAEDLDSASRQVAHLAPPGGGLEGPLQPPLPTSAPTPGTATSNPSASASLEDLLPALVRKIAWSGDARRGAVRIELGAGALAGATLLVAADGARVRVTLSGQSGVELEPYRERIVARLAARGLDADVT